jgi:hypothetical protein
MELTNTIPTAIYVGDLKSTKFSFIPFLFVNAPNDAKHKNKVTKTVPKNIEVIVALDTLFSTVHVYSLLETYIPPDKRIIPYIPKQIIINKSTVFIAIL